jgi:DNA-binding MarR family transcriptional regulator
MTADQYVLLSVLVSSGEATQQELVRRCYSDTATIGTMLSLLEAKRLVTRTPHPRDGRALNVKLTRAGRNLAEEMRQSSSSVRVGLSTLFNEQELRTLLEFLDRLAGAMQPPRRKSAESRSRPLKTTGT